MKQFITVEGIEGVGKSVAVNYIAAALERQSHSVLVTHEPGGTPLAEEIRHLLLHKKSEEKIIPEAELLLMFASRLQHVNTLIKPALLAGRFVLCDRFTDSSYAYQGYGRGLSLEKIALLDEWVGLVPDMTILLDAPVAIARSRAEQRSDPDRIEQEAIEFFERVRQGFLLRAKKYPERYRVIQSDMPLKAVQAALDVLLAEMVL